MCLGHEDLVLKRFKLFICSANILELDDSCLRG